MEAKECGKLINKACVRTAKLRDKQWKDGINRILRDYDKEVRKEAQKHSSHFASYQYFNTKLSVIKEIKVRLKEVLK